MKEITVESVKKALLDRKFRNLYPDLEKDMDKWMDNPGCKCNIPLYNTILSDIEILKKYFGSDIVITSPPLPEDNSSDQINHWTVFNGSVNDLEKFLNDLSSGPKQVAVARWEDQITVIVNDPDFI
jgi:hypothetical protein